MSEEFIIEFIALGNSVKVTVVDPVSMKEVSMVGPKTASRHELTKVAVNKMKYVLAKEQK